MEPSSGLFSCLPLRQAKGANPTVAALRPVVSRSNVKPESGTETARSTVHPCPRARRLCRDVRHLPGEPRGKVCGWYRYTDDDPWRIETLHQLGVRNRTLRRSNASRSASRSASSTRKTDT